VKITRLVCLVTSPGFYLCWMRTQIDLFLKSINSQLKLFICFCKRLQIFYEMNFCLFRGWLVAFVSNAFNDPKINFLWFLIVEIAMHLQTCGGESLNDSNESINHLRINKTRALNKNALMHYHKVIIDS
jgi:hypothetical protein